MKDSKNDFLTRLYQFPKAIVIVIALVTVFFAFQIPRAELDNNNIRFVPENDEARLINQFIDDTFGSSFFILIALERKYDDVFNAPFLNRIREFNTRMEYFEIVGNINSIVSSDFIFAEDDAIVVQKLVREDFSGTPAEIAELRQRLLSWDIYRRSLISDDFRATQILIPLNIDNEMASRPEIIDSFIEIRDIANEMFRGYANVYVTGLPVIIAVINEAMRADLITMIPLVVLVVLVVLFFSFRNFTPVVLPLVAVLAATVWTMGAMPLAGIKLSVVTTVLPVILVAVGSAYGIHMITHYLDALKRCANPGPQEHFLLVISVVRKIGKPVFLTAITTMAGFFSFCFTSVIPIREFGFFATFGVFVTFLMAVLLIPALLIIKGNRETVIAERVELSPIPNSPLSTFFAGMVQKKEIVIFFFVIIISFAVWGASKVVIDNIFVEYFKPATDIYRSDRFIRENFGGSKVVSVVVKADDTETLLMPQVLTAVDRLGTYLENRVPEVGKVLCFTDLIKRVNQVFNAGECPTGLRPVVRQELPSLDEWGFGFWDFGFDSFALEDTLQYSTPYTQETALRNSPLPNSDPPISAEEIVSLFRQAASSGRNRFMDVNQFVRELERLINHEGAAYYEIPADPYRYGKTTQEELSQLIANYLILLSGNIASYANDPLSPTAIRTTVQLRTVGNIDSERAINRIRAFIAYNFPTEINGRNISTIIGGTAMIEASLNRLVVESQIISLIFSVVVVFLLVSLFNRSFVAGFIGITPLSICILINFAVMGFTGIKLNIGTSMMASLCVGIGIDYAIHYIEAYKREYQDGSKNFILQTFNTSGRAIFINAISVSAGFAVLLFSQFVMLQDLGLLISLTMLTSAAVSLTIIPLLFLAIKPKFIYDRNSKNLEVLP